MAHSFSTSLPQSATQALVESALLDITASDRNRSRLKMVYIDNWKLHLLNLLADMPVPSALRDEIYLCDNARLLSHASLRSQVSTLLAKLSTDSAFYPHGVSIYQQNRGMPDEVFNVVFLDNWQQSIELQLQALQQQLIDEQRQQLLDELSEREETLAQLEFVIDSELFNNGERLWDLAQAKLSHLDTQLLQRFASNIRKHKEIKQLVMQLGRMAVTHVSQDENANSVETWVLDNSYHDDIPDDMQGVTYSDEISRMLQTEAVNLTFPELEIIFYKRYLERHLLSYQYQGMLPQYKLQTQYCTSADANEQPGGPIIICIDSSTSMQGFPELTAKSICYAILQLAFSQRRQCYLMMFANEVITYPVTAHTSLASMLTFLSSSFRGGTDLQPVIEQSLQLMQSGQYQNADTLVISDFIAQKLPSQLAEQVRTIKAHKNRYHAVSLSSQGNPQLMQIFDHVWRFSSGLLGGLKQLR